ncbi:hypothetical protein [Kitasatospora cathayae]|uniref:DUF3618 domain-containing protein n=1 Tax=Kitasatospora cathayae TaxID=3004092 RepID=A0ABY7Q311_9ACTN|nr:hypothetical protein [Kitasatospora sp. HUAS 3-15]WBP87034.1 hypothetical protein O1G21_15070 [Kitasatospora sp. HUAS 3-15]
MSNGADPLGVVTITAREIYDEIVGMREDVRSVAQTQRDTDETLEDHERRIRAVERLGYVAIAVTGLVGTGAAVYSAVK